MSDVEVLLRETVENLGVVGDVVRVRAGYARNYLLPRRLAVEANEENKRVMAKRRAAWEAQQARFAAEVEARVEALSRAKLRTEEKADENGHLFGSVNAARVAELLREAGYPVEEGQVRLEKPIKRCGTHRIQIHVHGQHNAEIVLDVEPEGGFSDTPPSGDANSADAPNEDVSAAEA